MDPQQQAVLAQLNRPGWKVTGQRPEVKSVQGPPDAYGQPSKTDQPTGNIVWIITGPGGQSDEVVVKPPSAPNVPFENPNDPGAKPGASSYTVVEGPKNNVQQPSTQTRSNYQHYTNPVTGKVYESWDGHPWSEAVGLPTDTKSGPTPAGKLETINDPTTGKPIKLRDPATGTVIDLPNATPTRPQIVDGPNGSKYSWDGENLKQVLPGATPQPTTVSTNANEQFIVERDASGNLIQKPNPNYRPPTPTTVSTNTDQQFIVERDASGNLVQKPNPNYKGQPPQVINPGTGPNIVRQDPMSGAISTVPNPNTTDVVARTQQLQEQARAKSAELQQAVQSGRTTPEQAAADFDSWWETNIAPQSQQITQTQQAQQYDYQTKQRDQQRLEEGQQTANLSTAQQAGRDVVSAYTAQDRNRVGPGYGQAFADALNSWKTGKPAPDITPDAVMYQAPDLNQMYEQAVARSLAHISPTAARIAGQPMPQIPQGFDVTGALNKSSYAPKTTISPDGTVTIDHAPQPAQSSNAQVGMGPYMLPDYSPAAAPF